MNDEHIVKKYEVHYRQGDRAAWRLIEANTWKLDDKGNLHIVYNGDTIFLIASGTWLFIERVYN